MVIHDDDAAGLEGAEVLGVDGGKLGTVAGVYFDNETDHPEWVEVKSGLFGLNTSLVPLATAELRGGALHVPFDKEQLRSAPHHSPGHQLTPQEEIDLFRHYDISYDTWAGSQPSSATGGPATPSPDARPARTGAATDAGTDEAMTRSEEQLRVHTESEVVGRVRLRKYVVTEYQTVTVPVRREEIRVERVPVGDEESDAGDTVAGTPVTGETVATGTGSFGGSAAARAGTDPSAPVDVDGEQEIILYAERPVVQTETVAVERIVVGKHTVTEQETVTGEVRREEIEVDTDPHPRDPR